MNLSVALRRVVAEQVKKYAHAESIPHCFSYGEAPVVCFSAYEGDTYRGISFIGAKHLSVPSVSYFAIACQASRVQCGFVRRESIRQPSMRGATGWLILEAFL